MDWTLELVVVPVTDVDRAKAYYAEKLGFNVDVDHSSGENFRIVQLTPPGSACSVTIMRTPFMQPGTLHGLHLVVPDIEAARAELVGRGADVSDYYHFGAEGQTPGLDPDRRNYGSYATITDPDGNTLLLQEVNRARAEEEHPEKVEAGA